MSKRRIAVDAEGVCTRPLDIILSDLSTQYGVGGIRPDDWFGADAAERQGKPVWVRLWRYSAIRGGRSASAWHPAEKTLKHEPQRNTEPEREEQWRRPVLPPACPPQRSTYTNPMGEQSPVLCGPPPFARKEVQDLADWQNNSRPPVMPGTPITSPLAEAFPATPSEERLRRQQDGWLRWNITMPYAGWLFVATLDNGGVIGPLHLAELAVGERPVKWIRVNPMMDGDCGGQWVDRSFLKQLAERMEEKDKTIDNMRDAGVAAVTLLRKLLHDDVGWFNSAIELDHPCGLDGVTLRKEAAAVVAAYDEANK